MFSRTNGGCYIKPLCSHAYFFSRNRRPYRGVNLPGFLGETRKMIFVFKINSSEDSEGCHSLIFLKIGKTRTPKRRVSRLKRYCHLFEWLNTHDAEISACLHATTEEVTMTGWESCGKQILSQSQVDLWMLPFAVLNR